jgi:hypothetical protein
MPDEKMRGKEMFGENYSVNQRIRGGAFVSRLNPAIVSSHINADIGAKHLPMPMVRSTFQRKAVPEQDKNRLQRIEILNRKFKK